MIAKDICGLEPATQLALQKIFRENSQITAVILYGSRAKGTFKEGSDIDLAIVAPAMRLPDLLKLQTTIDDLLLPFKTDAILMHQIDNDGLRDHIKRVGQSFYEV